MPILQFTGTQFERQFDTCLYQEYSIEQHGIKKIPDICIGRKMMRNEKKGLLQNHKEILWIGEIKLAPLTSFYDENHAGEDLILKQLITSMLLAKLNYSFLFTTETIAKTEILRVNEDKQVVLKVKITGNGKQRAHWTLYNAFFWKV